MSLSFRIPQVIICLFFFSFFSGCGEKELSTEEIAIQAEQLLDAGQSDAAIRILEARLEIEPERIDLLEPLAFAYIASNDPVMSAMTFSRIAEITPERVDARIWAAQSLKEAGDNSGAVNQYKLYLEQSPSDRSIWITLAELEEDLGNLSQSLDAYLRADAIQPDGFTQMQIGRLYLALGNVAQAQRWYAFSLEQGEPHRGPALLGLLETSIASKQFKSADTIISQLDSEYPGLLDQSQISDVRDQIAEWKKRREEAELALKELEKPREIVVETPEEIQEEMPVATEVSDEIDTELPSTENEDSITETPPTVEEEIASNASENLEISGAEESSEPEVLERQQPSTPQEWLDLARLSRENGQIEEAISAYKRYLVTYDERADIWGELSQAYYQNGNYRWAQATASEAMRRDPFNPDYMLLLLEAAKETMTPRSLMKEMEKAYRKFPNDPPVILVLATANLENRNYRNAQFLMEHFLDITPLNHPERPQVEAVLNRIKQGS